MSAVKGKLKSEFEQELFTGWGLVEVVAINPSRSELDKLLGISERDEEAKEIEYLGENKETDKKQVRLNFVLKEKESGRIFYHNIYIIDDFKGNKDGTKDQYINSTLSTTWIDDVNNLPIWFTNFTDKNKNVRGDKTWRKAFVGEEELVTLLRSWLNLNYNDPETEVVIDIKKLLKGNTKELQELITSEYATPFVALFGVKTVEKTDNEGNSILKQYQSVYGKAFLQKKFIKFIENNKFPDEYNKKIWDKVLGDIKGEYGFKSSYTLGVLQKYNPELDVVAGNEPKIVSAEDASY